MGMMQTTSEVTAETLGNIRAWLTGAGWNQTAGDRFEHRDLPLAVESGYVYGEVTVKIFRTRGARNVAEPVGIHRGIGVSFAWAVIEEIREQVGRVRDEEVPDE